ncbi:hypothetical protein HK28_04600 [Acetobacter sp. DsW_063]|nr:hypothetical protein HK28_04600 [Acetobacter sp. DsW_063]
MSNEILSRIAVLERQVADLQLRLGDADPTENARHINLISKIIAALSVNSRELWKAVNSGRPASITRSRH